MDERIEKFFTSPAFGVVGASANRDKYGNKVLRCYQMNNKTVIPVNQRETEVEGIACVASVATCRTASRASPSSPLRQLLNRWLQQQSSGVSKTSGCSRVRRASRQWKHAAPAGSMSSPTAVASWWCCVTGRSTELLRRGYPEHPDSMKFRVSSHILQVQPPPISEVKRWLAARAPDLPLVDLCQAVPDYPPERGLTDHLKTLLDDPLTAKYSPDEGLPEVREAICTRYQQRYGAVIDPCQICLTIGASQAFWLAMTVLCRAGDEVIVQLPAYFDHPMALQALGIRVCFRPFLRREPGHA